MLFLFQSCMDWKKPKQIEKIDVLKEDLSKLEQFHTDSDELAKVISLIENVELRLIQNSNGDTLSIEFAKILNEYSSIRPGLILIQEKIPLIDSLFVIRQNGVESLKSDIEKGIGVRSRYDENISFEEDAMKEFSFFVFRCDSLLKNSLGKFESLNDRVNEYSLDLERKTRNNN